MDKEKYVESLLLPDGDSSAKIHRAEAALERRLYKALDRLAALPAEGGKSVLDGGCG